MHLNPNEITKQVRFRVGMFKKLILQVKVVEEDCDFPDFNTRKYEYWRDAKLEDFNVES